MRGAHAGGVCVLLWARISGAEGTGKTEEGSHGPLRAWPLHEHRQRLGGTRFTSSMTMAQY
jgi:hypothetical protein